MIKVVTPPVTIHDVDIVATLLIAHQPYFLLQGDHKMITAPISGSVERPFLRGSRAVLSVSPCT